VVYQGVSPFSDWRGGGGMAKNQAGGDDGIAETGGTINTKYGLELV
jgi:hypothetical protein